MKQKITKTLLEKAIKHGVPSYSITGRFIKGWTLNGEYIPNPQFTPENILQVRLMIFETINRMLKAGFEVVKEMSVIKGQNATLTLKRGSDVKKIPLNADEYKEIITHLSKTIHAV